MAFRNPASRIIFVISLFLLGAVSKLHTIETGSGEVSPRLSAEIDILINKLGGEVSVAEEKEEEILDLLKQLNDWSLSELDGEARPRRDVAYHELMSFGESAIPVLANALKNPDKKLRRNAIWALHGVLWDREGHRSMITFTPYVKDCLPLYFELLSDEDYVIRKRVVSGLASISRAHKELRSTIIPFLVPLLNDHDELIAAQVSEALEDMGYRGHLPKD